MALTAQRANSGWASNASHRTYFKRNSTLISRAEASSNEWLAAVSGVVHSLHLLIRIGKSQSQEYCESLIQDSP